MGLFDNINTVLESDVFDQWMGSPLSYMGAGLASQGNLGAGFLAGAQGYRRDREQRSMADYRNAQIEAQQQAIAQRKAQAQAAQEQRALRQQWMQQNYPHLVNAPEALQNEVFKSQFEKPDQTSAMQNLMAAGLQPGTPQFQQAMLEYMMKPQTAITTPPSPADIQKQGLAFYKEVVGVEKPFRVALDGMQMIQALAKNPSGVSDQALIAAFAKIIDPGSVVRESEAAAIQNTSGLLAQLGVKLNQILEGEKLTPKQRADIARVAGERFKAAERQFLQNRARLNKMSEQFQIGNVVNFAEDLGQGYQPLEVPTLSDGNQTPTQGGSWSPQAEEIFRQQNQSGGF